MEEYIVSDMERELGMTREKLTHLALLLGSDYTEGISGIGIVNAMETVHAFPTLEDLKAFKAWLQSPDTNLLAPLEKRNRKLAAAGVALVMYSFVVATYFVFATPDVLYVGASSICSCSRELWKACILQ